MGSAADIGCEAGRVSGISGRACAVDDVSLWWRLDGDGPAVVLLPGRGDSSDLFPSEFTDLLIASGLGVLRHDPRDTGLSDDGGNTYRLSEMASDVMTICDAAGLDRFHVVAVSMGGMVTVDLAVRHPRRVASLAFIAAMSPDPAAGIGEAFFDGIDADPILGTLAAMGSPAADDRVWVEAQLQAARSRAPERPSAGIRHQEAAFRLGWRELDDLGRLTMPALVVHGTADRVLPIGHAHALAAGIEDAALHVLDGMGHLPTRAEWIQLAGLVADFTMHTD
ncbi:MAG: alpha/beta fold hydrolase [Ilumatobacteraceae bacterium]